MNLNHKKSWNSAEKPCLLFYRHALKAFLPLPDLTLFFINKKWFFFFSSFFLSSGMHQSQHLVGCYATSINYLLIPFLNTLFIFITPNYKSKMNYSFQILIVKIIIVKVNNIKVYSIKAHIIKEECNNIRLYIISVYFIIRE